MNTDDCGLKTPAGKGNRLAGGHLAGGHLAGASLTGHEDRIALNLHPVGDHPRLSNTDQHRHDRAPASPPAPIRLFFPCLCVFLLASPFFFPSLASAGWFDNQWQFRRVLDVNWDAANAEGSELATADFFTAGHHLPGGADVRVTGEAGRVVPSHVLTAGPGDRVRLVFALTKGQSKYYAYFGNPKPVAPPKGTEDVKYHCGLLLDMKAWPAGGLDSCEQLADEWVRAVTPLGQLIIDRPFYGLDPFGDHPNWISKVTGSLAVPSDGDYKFAASADDRGALYIDGQAVLFVPGNTGDIRFNKTIALKKGRHDFVFYHVNVAGEGMFSVGWKRPDMNKVDVIGRESFGVVAHAQPGPLEEYRKALTADFIAEYEGECFVADNYSHRYKLTARSNMANAKAEWDLGDGATAVGPEVEHVYMTDGVYPVRLTFKLGANADVQTTKLAVSRDYEHVNERGMDEPAVHAKIIAKYDVNAVPARWLPWMALMEQRTGMTAAMTATARRLAAEQMHVNSNISMSVLEHVSQDLDAAGKADDVVALWDLVPADSDLQPRAARYEAQQLMWWVGDFDKALKVAQPLAASDDKSAKRVYAEALVLAGRADDGRKILDDLQEEDKNSARLAAISGAMARTIEFRLDEKDWETGEEEWEKWESRCPSVFLQGYSVLLRTKLMEEKKAPAAAAKVAEAFAKSVPNSSYAPQLLDRASKLLAKTDPKKSEELRNTLKTRYPEDPLSQDTAAGAGGTP